MEEGKSSTAEINKAALKKFYSSKDPFRVKNVDILFLRYEEDDILYFVKHKYGESVEGWVDSIAPSPPSTPVAGSIFSETSTRSSQGFYNSAIFRKSGKKPGSLSLRQKSVRSMKDPVVAASSSLKSVVTVPTTHNSDSDDSEHETTTTTNKIPPTSPVHILPTPPRIVSVPKITMTKEEVDAKIAEIAERERIALERAREEERLIKEKQAKAKEAIERAMKELADAEAEIETVKREMELEKKHVAEVKQRRQTMNRLSMLSPAMLAGTRSEAILEEDAGSFSTKDSLAEEEAKLAEEEVALQKKELALKLAEEEANKNKLKTIQKIQQAEAETVLLMVEENKILRAEVDIANKLQLVDDLNEPVEMEDHEEEAVVAEETLEEEEPLVVSAAPARMTRYERKLQEALEAPEPASRSKSIMGGLLGRLTKTPVSASASASSKKKLEVIEEPSDVMKNQRSTTMMSEDDDESMSATPNGSVSFVSHDAALVPPSISPEPPLVAANSHTSSSPVVAPVSAGAHTSSPMAAAAAQLLSKTASKPKTNSATFVPEEGTPEYAQYMEFQQFKQQQQDFQKFQHEQFILFQEQRLQKDAAPVVVATTTQGGEVKPRPISYVPHELQASVNELADENAKLRKELEEAKLAAENARLKRELEEAKRLIAAANAPPPSPQIIYVQQQQQPVQQQPMAVSSPVVAAAAVATPVVTAAESGGGGGEDDGSGYLKYPRGHAETEKYRKMQKAGLPQGPIENAMLRDFIHPASLFDSPLNVPKIVPGGVKKPAAAAAPPPASSSTPGENGEFAKLPNTAPELEKYKKMQKAGLPQGPIENAMMRDFIHPSSLYGAQALNDPKPKPKAAAAPAASGGGAAPGEFAKLPNTAPELEKYKKMQKAGLPQGPIENAMMRDFIHPSSLYGAQALNDPKPPKGGAAAVKPAAPMAAKPVAAAAPVDDGKPPPGMSMMEEMKWKQAQKAKGGNVAKPPIQVKQLEKPVAAAPVDDGKPPPGMSMMEEMKWKQAQKAKLPPKPVVEFKPVEKVVPKEEPMKLGDKPPPGLSMMEEMKWKQAQKKLKEEHDKANGINVAPVTVPAKSAAAASSSMPNFKLGLKSTGTGGGGGSEPPKPAPAWAKAPTKAVIQTATKLAAIAPVANVDALVSLLVGAKISKENAEKYAAALAQEGFDAPEKLALLDDADLAACGITSRFDIKVINTLKKDLPKTIAATPTPAAAAAPSTAGKSAPPSIGFGAKPPLAASKPGFAPSIPKPATTTGPSIPSNTATPGKPNFVINKKPEPVAATPPPPAVKTGGQNFVVNKKPGAPVPSSAPPPVTEVKKPVLKNSAEAQKAKEAERLAFVLSLGAPLDSYKKPKQIG